MIYFDFLNVAQYDKWCYFLDFFLEGEKERERGELFILFFLRKERGELVLYACVCFLAWYFLMVLSSQDEK